jgi:hypothetical protein
MRKMMITLLFVALLFSTVFAEEKAAVEKKSEPIGLAAGIDYYSLYLFRGTKFSSGDGAFYPKASWTVFDTGLVLSVSSEVASSWVFNGFSHKPGKYSFLVNSMPSFNQIAYATQSLDFGADYSYTINNAVTLGASVWYWWYFNSRNAREYARPQVDGLNRVSYVDISFLTTAASIGLPIVPFVNPALTLIHDYYTGLERGGDYYVQLGLSHPFELTKEAAITLGGTASYYYSTTAKLTRYNLVWDASPGAPDTTESVSYSGQTRTITWGGIKQMRTPLKKGFSDITPYLSVTIAKGSLSLNGGFYWCIVPSKTWYNGAEVHRFYAKVGAAYAI